MIVQIKEPYFIKTEVEIKFWDILEDAGYEYRLKLLSFRNHCQIDDETANVEFINKFKSENPGLFKCMMRHIIHSMRVVS